MNHEGSYMRRCTEELLDDIENGNAIVIVWTVNDVLDCASSINVELSEDDARSALRLAYDNYDPIMGITWDEIEVVIRETVSCI